MSNIIKSAISIQNDDKIAIPRMPTFFLADFNKFREYL